MIISSPPERPARKSTRLKGYDYAQNGAYFVTICTQNRECLFGRVVTGDMRLNYAGVMIMQHWDKLPSKFPRIELDTCVLMPNHLHGIVVIHDGDTAAKAGAPRQQKPSLNDVMQWFKMMTTNAYIRGVKEQGWESFPGKLWQRSFHDHILRNESDLNTRRGYIATNPARWTDDEHYLP